MNSKNEQIVMDGVFIGSYLPYAYLSGTFWTVRNMCDLEVTKKIKEILDNSPIAAVKKTTNAGSIKIRTTEFAGALTPIVENRINHPLGVWAEATSGGRYCFYLMMDLDKMGRRGAAEGPDVGYSWVNISLSRKKLTEYEIFEFKELFTNLIPAINPFYACAVEHSIFTQRNVFMAKAVEHPVFRKTIPDYSREIWDVYWLNYFGPAYVDHWGQDKIAALGKKYEVTGFGNGGVCVQTTPEPVLADPEAKGITDYEFKKHFYEVLGYDTFMHETHKPGRPGQYVPILEEHRRRLKHEPSVIVSP